MSFDAWIVAFGLSDLAEGPHLVESNRAYLVMVAVGMLDMWLLYRFFSVQLPMVKRRRSARGERAIDDGHSVKTRLHAPRC
jgi:hypothetical protein